MDKLFISIFASLLFITACVDSDYKPEPGQYLNTVTFALNMPGSGITRTTKAQTPEECYIETVDILVFDLSGVFQYTVQATAAGENKYEVKLKKETIDLVVLVNARQQIDHAVTAGMAAGDSRADVEKAIQYTLPGDGKWIAGANGYAFPMFGEEKNFVVQGGASQSIPTVKMSRMVARVDVSLQDAAKNKFILEEVFVYHSCLTGQVMPTGTNWGIDGSGDPVATAPSLAVDNSGTVLPDTKGPQAYNDHASDGSNAYVSEIYLFEAAKGATGNHPRNICLVLGGTYKATGEKTFYRVDFMDPANPTNFMPVRRNHNYLFRVSDVNAPGYPSAEEAYLSEPGVEIKALVTEWNLAKSTVLFDGQYTFTISRDKLGYDNDAGFYQIEVSTDHPKGITIGTPSESWFTVNGLAPGSKSGTFWATAAANTTGTPRSATVILSIGETGNKLDYTLTATQSEINWINWINHQIYYTNGKAYTTGNGKAAKITSISNWSATISDPHGIISSNDFIQGGTGTNTVVDYSFTLNAKQPDDLYHIAEVTFRDLSGTYPDKIYPVVNMESRNDTHAGNSIIVTGTGSVKIPNAYRKAFAIWRYGDGKSGLLGNVSTMAGAWDANVIWQDEKDMLRDANISFNSSTGEIEIASTSSALGNAVVALQVGGINVWSWHIWKPSITLSAIPAGWTNMNLGAMVDTLHDPESKGLLYQWGRKDPFLTIATFTELGNTKQPYNGRGEKIIVDLANGSPQTTEWGINNLENSIRNPFMYYYNVGPGRVGDTDWYTNEVGSGSENEELGITEYANQNNYLWNSRLGDKTPFDPCPAGYRVPDSNVNSWSELNRDNFPWNGTGRINQEYGGYYPANGRRTMDGGRLLYGDSSGRCWTGNTKDDCAYNLEFSIMFSSVSVHYRHRAFAWGVRCVTGD